MSEDLYCSRRIRIVLAAFGRTLVPTVLKIYYLCLKQQSILVSNLRLNLLKSALIYIASNISRSLKSLQQITYSSVIHKRNHHHHHHHDLDEGTFLCANNTLPEKSVECQILYTPPANSEIQADIIFIHGLHGGIDRTWKQGQWRHDRHKLRDQAPVRRQSTGNLFVPPRRQASSLRRTFSGFYARRRSKNCQFTESSGDRVQDVGESEWEVVREEEYCGVDEGAQAGYSNCWPKDWIPKDCPGARVIALNYTTDLLWAPVWMPKRQRTGLIDRSDEMIEELLNIDVGKRPIIWVGHSKGGLFIKQIILNAWEKHRHLPEVYNILQQSKAIMFYSVPHKGSILADLTLPLLRRSVELIEIRRNCDFVLDLHQRFLRICEEGHLSAEIFSFIETSFTLMAFLYLKIIAYDSADPDVGRKCDVPLDHREICKPAGRDCFLYLELIKLINKQIVIKRDNNNHQSSERMA